MLNFAFLVIQVIFLESVLSIDNAIVLASMASKLPKDKPIPVPKALNFLKPFLQKIFKHQQHAAMEVGLLGAYVGRAIMLLLASFIIEYPVLKILGALYLIHLAFESMGQMAAEHMELVEEVEDDVAEVEERLGLLKRVKQASFWQSVLAIEMADLIFSLDNVVAVVALSSKFTWILAGVVIGILIIRLFAGYLINIIEKHPLLGLAGYILLLVIAIELLADVLFGIELEDTTKFLISFSIVLLTLAFEYLPSALQKILKDFAVKIGIVLYKVNYFLTFNFLQLKKNK